MIAEPAWMKLKKEQDKKINADRKYLKSWLGGAIIKLSDANQITIKLLSPTGMHTRFSNAKGDYVDVWSSWTIRNMDGVYLKPGSKKELKQSLIDLILYNE